MSSCLNLSVGSKMSISFVARKLEEGVSRGEFATSFDWQ